MKEKEIPSGSVGVQFACFLCRWLALLGHFVFLEQFYEDEYILQMATGGHKSTMFAFKLGLCGFVVHLKHNLGFLRYSIRHDIFTFRAQLLNIYLVIYLLSVVF